MASGCVLLACRHAPLSPRLLEQISGFEANLLLVLALGGISLWGRARAEAGLGWRSVALFFAVLTAFLGAATLLENVMGYDFGLDHLITTASHGTGGASARMGLSAGITTLAFGTALSLMAWPMGNQVAQFLALGGIMVSVLSAWRGIPVLAAPELLSAFRPIRPPIGPVFVFFGIGLFCEHQRRILNWIDVERRRIRTEIEKLAAEDLARLSSQFKSEFLVGMGHEFRTPMNGILGMMTALQDTRLDRQQREYVETARQSADNLVNSLANIMSYWEGQSGTLTYEPGEVDVRETVAAAVKAVSLRAQRKGLELAYFISEETPARIRCDRQLILGTLLQLLSNAVKFTEQGEIVLNVSKVSEKSGVLQLVFSVSDSGMGVAPEAEARLFQPFSSAESPILRRHSGIGLGLVIAKRMVELMGGSIGHQSSAGQGATFWFSIHLEELPASTATPTGLEGRRVLIVGESAGGGNLLQLQLAAWRMEPEVVGTTAEAFVSLSDAVNRGRVFSALLLNESVPAGESQALIRKMRAYPFLAKTRIVRLRRRANVEEKTDASLDADVLLDIPLMPHELEDALKTLLSPAKKPTQISPEIRARARILVAEDDRVNQKVAMIMLKKLGLAADLAENGLIATQKFQKGRYDLVLMDCNMPEMDGYQATQTIRKMEGGARHTPIIALTANTLKADRKKCLDAGMDAYLSKPINPTDLNQALLQWLKPDLTRALPAGGGAPAAAGAAPGAPEAPSAEGSLAQEAAPAESAAEVVPVENAAEAAPAEGMAEVVEVGRPSDAAPVEEVVEVVPVENAAEAVPVESAAEEVPVERPVEAAPAESAAEAVPAAHAAEEVAAGLDAADLSGLAQTHSGSDLEIAEDMDKVLRELLEQRRRSREPGDRNGKRTHPEVHRVPAEPLVKASAPLPAAPPRPPMKPPPPTAKPAPQSPTAKPAPQPTAKPAPQPPAPKPAPWQPASPPPAETIIDPAALQNLRELGGGEELVIEAIKAFIDEEAPHLTGSLRKAIEAGLPDDMRKAAHTLKGASSAVGAMRLAGLCKTLEEQGAHGSMEKADVLYVEVVRECEKACVALQDHLG